MVSEHLVSLHDQLQRAEEQLRLIRERMAEYVLPIDIPLDLTRRERELLREIEDLRSRLARLRDEPCPYLGLESFDTASVDVFFGREQDVKQLADMVGTQNLVVVVGPSGCGKSSLVHAGLQHSLQTAAPPWHVTSLLPGTQPVRNLCYTLVEWVYADATPVVRSAETSDLLAQIMEGKLTLSDFFTDSLRASTDHRLIIIDQFEEIFTEEYSADTRTRFIDLLLDLVRTNLPLHIVCALRADFYDSMLRHAAFSAAVGTAIYNVLPLGPADLRRAIEVPALKRGRRFEAGLVERVAEDISDEPGNLPLLQFLLTQLWVRQTSAGVLTHAQYTELGGVQQALIRYAEEQLDALHLDLKELEKLFLQLVRPSRDGPDTRRVARREDVGESGWEMATQLAQKRLLVLNRTPASAQHETVEVAHEALIREWPRLREWLADDREFRLWLERLRAQLPQWHDNPNDEGVLLRGAPLSEAEGWLGRRADDLAKDERAFIQSSIDLRERERAEGEERARRELELERRARWRLQQLVGLLSVEAGIATVVAAVLIYPLLVPFWTRSPVVRIPGGQAVIGTDDPQAETRERPIWHPMVQSFAIERFEVSNAQYQKCVEFGKCSLPIQSPPRLAAPDLPVVGVTTYQAAEYCAWVRRRLPTELELEYAARGPSGAALPWASTVLDSEHANVLFDEPAHGPDRVDSHPQGGRDGVLNLVGNVWEWTMSYDQSYENYDVSLTWDARLGASPEQDALIQRGGGWEDTFRRVTERKTAPAFEPGISTGFRCAAPLL